MKKIFIIVLTLLFSLLLVSCLGGGANVTETTDSTVPEESSSVPEETTDIPTDTTDTEEVSIPTAPDRKITFTDKDGSKVELKVLSEADVTSYIIFRTDIAGDSLKKAVSKLRKGILNKTDEGLKIDTDFDYEPTEGVYEIVVSEKTGKAEKFSASQYEISTEDNRIYILGGSSEVLDKAIDLFLEKFIDAESKKLLLAETYTFSDNFFLGNVTVNGVSIENFKVSFDSADEAYRSPSVLSEELAIHLSNTLLSSNGHKKIEYKERMSTGSNYIVLSARSLDVDDYSIRVENGNIYVDASFMSLEKAIEHLALKVLGAKRYESDVDTSAKIALKNGDKFSGKVDFKVPYTKEKLIKAVNDAYENDDMIIFGTEAFNYENTSNGCAIKQSIDKISKSTEGVAPAFVEFDLGQYSSLNPNNMGDVGLSDYDISRIVSESAEHVMAGGIIGICAHIDNPLSPTSGFRGNIGTDAVFKQLYNEGTQLNKNLLISSEIVFKVLKAFNDNGIPVLFRPFHEMTGNWFWWCVNQNSNYLKADTWIGLWRYYHDYVTKTLGVDSAVWVYSTACRDSDYAYPGDKYVDIVGCDWYSNGNRELNGGGDYDTLMSLGKPVAITEFGGPSPKESDYTSLTMLSDLKWMIENDMKLSFILVWTSNASIAGMGHAKDFIEDPIIYSRDDMMEYWKK